MSVNPSCRDTSTQKPPTHTQTLPAEWVNRIGRASAGPSCLSSPAGHVSRLGRLQTQQRSVRNRGYPARPLAWSQVASTDYCAKRVLVSINSSAARGPRRGRQENHRKRLSRSSQSVPIPGRHFSLCPAQRAPTTRTCSLYGAHFTSLAKVGPGGGDVCIPGNSAPRRVTRGGGMARTRLHHPQYHYSPPGLASNGCLPKPHCPSITSYHTYMDTVWYPLVSFCARPILRLALVKK